jgi:hypothetical protein
VRRLIGIAVTGALAVAILVAILLFLLLITITGQLDFWNWRDL